MVELKIVEIPQSIFDYILDSYPTKVRVKNNIRSYFNGTKENKQLIYTDGIEWIVCQESRLNYASQQILGTDCISGCTTWKQVRLRLQPESKVVKSLYNGSYCYNYIMKIVKKYYTSEEIEEIYNTHSREKDENLKQYHYRPNLPKNKIYSFDNCYYYDINGAHSYMVMELFPKCKKELLKLYERKNYYKKVGKLEEAEKIKCIFNYFVGELCNKNHRGTYNYIVQETTKRLLNTMDYLDGVVIYSNTDSIIVQNPKRLINTSDILGEYKLESSGRVYYYENEKYFLFEYKKVNGEYETKGNCRTSLRHLVELRNNLVVHYNSERKFLGYDENGNKRYIDNLQNVRQEKLDEKSKKNLL